ncbi:hypothetical protein ASF04_12845 [Duganella sp. Leaf61]|uniref:glycosyltransferase n=1 Tax=Duganella sp. Leaf61 TaxID=1736227 RepID=UPI0006F8B826|nr:glycosyltransferase [Duganella sp. Leaf61]KQN70701.1 hypothetical protein ASF04_12845 [Duganella sp. Leaf61]
MLKIALISSYASPLAVSGSVDCDSLGFYVGQLGSELGALGCQVDIFTRRYRIEQPQVHFWRPNVRIIHVPAGPPGVFGREPLQPYIEQFGRFMVGFARRQRGGYDIAHACDLRSGCAAQQLRRTLGVPYVVTLHAPPAQQGSAAAVALQQQLLKDADSVLVLCRQHRDALQGLPGRAHTRIDIVPCGFDPALFWPVRLRARGLLGLPSDAFLALYVGRLGSGHDIDTAIEGMAQLANRHAVAARLLVLGAAMPDEGGHLARPLDALLSHQPCETPRSTRSQQSFQSQSPNQSHPSVQSHQLSHLGEFQRLRDLAGRLDVEVAFLGPQPASALRHWYSAADVCVATSCYNAFGAAVLGAMACATPVVGVAAGCIDDMVLDGETGYLVAPHDPAALADRLASLHANPVQARSLGVQGWRRAHRHYTWRSVAQRLTAVYAQVLAGVAADVAADGASELAGKVASKVGASASLA